MAPSTKMNNGIVAAGLFVYQQTHCGFQSAMVAKDTSLKTIKNCYMNLSSSAEAHIMKKTKLQYVL